MKHKETEVHKSRSPSPSKKVKGCQAQNVCKGSAVHKPEQCASPKINKCSSPKKVINSNDSPKKERGTISPKREKTTNSPQKENNLNSPKREKSGSKNVQVKVEMGERVLNSPKKERSNGKSPRVKVEASSGYESMLKDSEGTGTNSSSQESETESVSQDKRKQHHNKIGRLQYTCVNI